MRRVSLLFAPLAALCCLFLLLISTQAQEKPKNQPAPEGKAAGKAPKNAKKSKAEKDPWALGPTGLFGIEKTRKLLVVSVASGSPSADKLEVGDLITHVAGQPIATSPKRNFLRQLAKAHAASDLKKDEKAKLAIKLLREKEELEVTIEITPLGSTSDFHKPTNAKAKAMLDAYLAWLVANQVEGQWRAGYSWTNGASAVIAMAGLAMLANNDAKHRPLLKEMADWLIERVEGTKVTTLEERQGAPNWNQDNWAWSFAGIFLAEYWYRSQSKAVKDKLGKIASAIVKNQEKDGGWAHGPGGENALKYTTFCQMSLQCLMALQLIKGCGVTIDDAAFKRGQKFVIGTISRAGGIGYSTKKNGELGYALSGRTAFATMLFEGDATYRKEQKKMRSYMVRNRNKAREGHASQLMHLVWQSLALRRFSDENYATFIKSNRWLFEGSFQHDGSAAAQPNKETRKTGSNFDRTHGKAWVTACNALILASRYERLVMQGAKIEAWPVKQEEEEPKKADDPEGPDGGKKPKD